MALLLHLSGVSQRNTLSVLKSLRQLKKLTGALVFQWIYLFVDLAPKTTPELVLFGSSKLEVASVVATLGCDWMMPRAAIEC